MNEDILLHIKNLIIEEKFDYCFDWLVSCFFNNLLIDTMTPLEKFQAIQAILLSVMKRLKESEDYEEMRAISEVYAILYSKIHKIHKHKKRVELIVADTYYQQQLHKILNK